MKITGAAYRIQLNSSFGFNNLAGILDYLSKLGVSTIYASPIFASQKGSAHGYDIIDPNRLNPELGSEKEFEELIRTAHEKNISWLQDIVPNHMAFSMQNRYLYDLMEKGKGSPYCNFFDIGWNHTSMKGKLMAPFLGDKIEICMMKKEIQLVFNDGYKIKYYDHEFPVDDNYSKKLTRTDIEKFNNDPMKLKKLIDGQTFKLTYWKDSFNEINYRRFFDINQLICVRVEDNEVFDETHKLILKLTGNGTFSGLRIDHIDGLYDPGEYAARLRKKAPGTYIIAEKILAKGEELPGWALQGTTGYEFMNYANSVMIDGKNAAEFDSLYKEFTRNSQSYESMVHTSKAQVIRDLFSGELENIASDFCKLSAGKISARKIKSALMELVIHMGIYRTYYTEKNQEGFQYLMQILAAAKHHNPGVSGGLDFLENLVQSGKGIHAFMRLQQLTGPAMAKGFEDTFLYRYTRLIGLNDVGSFPNIFGISVRDFHDFSMLRNEKWKNSLNTLSTHDTKRGEDVRARLQVLSEFPDEWKSNIGNWANMNAAKKTTVGKKQVPDMNEEYFLYQVLLASFPFEKEKIKEFEGRVKGYLVKSLREAKLNSSWLDPNVNYESAVKDFAAKIFADRKFLESFTKFQEKIAYFAVFNSLSQALLKMTCPGIPDVYQGTEFWDFSMVDPDNRRPVDFEERKKSLDYIEKNPDLKSMLKNYRGGKVKMFLIYKTLQFRREIQDLFLEGDYIPLKTEGTYKDNIISFARKKGLRWCVVVVPRLTSHVVKQGHLPLGDAWKDTSITLPKECPESLKNALTGEKLKLETKEGKIIKICKCFKEFPAALLSN